MHIEILVDNPFFFFRGSELSMLCFWSGPCLCVIFYRFHVIVLCTFCASTIIFHLKYALSNIFISGAIVEYLQD